MNKIKSLEKAFQIRLPKDLWLFLKKLSIEKEMSMNTIVINCLEKYKKSFGKKLTGNDFMVS